MIKTVHTENTPLSHLTNCTYTQYSSAPTSTRQPYVNFHNLNRPFLLNDCSMYLDLCWAGRTQYSWAHSFQTTFTKYWDQVHAVLHWFQRRSLSAKWMSQSMQYHLIYFSGVWQLIVQKRSHEWRCMKNKWECHCCNNVLYIHTIFMPCSIPVGNFM